MINRVLTSCDNNLRYKKFIPLFIEGWNKISKDVKVTIVYIGDKKELKTELEEHKLWKDSYDDVIVEYNHPEDIKTSYISQFIRILYPSLYNDEYIMISDIDMIPGNIDYYKRPFKDFNDVNGSTFICTRPRGITPYNQIPICYNIATPKIWKNINGVDCLEDIDKILSDNYIETCDGNHGGIGWYSDQEALCRMISEKDVKCIFYSDNYMGFNRLDYFHHNYDIDKFIQEYKSGKYSDCHIYAYKCTWSYDDVSRIIERLEKL